MYMDEEECFGAANLIEQMAEAMLLPLPPVQEFEYKEDDISLWNYGYHSDGLSSQTKNQSVMNNKITVQDEEKEQQHEKVLFIMGIPIRKEQAAQPQHVTDPVHHSPDPEVAFEDVAAAADGENRVENNWDNSSMHNIPEYLKTGQPTSSLPHHEGLENEGNAFQELSLLKLLFKDGNEQDEHVMDMKSNSNINSDEESSSGGTTSTSYNVAQILHLDELEEESHIKCIKPQSLTSQPKRSQRVLEDERNTMQIDHSSLEMLLGETVMPKQHGVIAERASHAVDELAEESLVIKDVGHAFSDEDTGYAMTTASKPSRFKSLKPLPRQEVKDKTIVSDTSAQKVMLLEDIIGMEDDGTNIHFARKRSIDDTSESKTQCEKDMNIENLSKHFGRPLVDAAKSFGVSRSTFKRICRGLGIERWQYGKRRMKSHSSSKLNRVNDQEPSVQNISQLSMPTLHVRTAAQTCQEITVKATYNGVAIRFELLDSSGIAELEDNVIERLKIKRGTFSIKYQDDEGDWVLIACDKDVRKCIEISRSLKKTTVKMLVDPPISHYAP